MAYLMHANPSPSFIKSDFDVNVGQFSDDKRVRLTFPLTPNGNQELLGPIVRIFSVN